MIVHDLIDRTITCIIETHQISLIQSVKRLLQKAEVLNHFDALLLKYNYEMERLYSH